MRRVTVRRGFSRPLPQLVAALALTGMGSVALGLPGRVDLAPGMDLDPMQPIARQMPIPARVARVLEGARVDIDARLAPIAAERLPRSVSLPPLPVASASPAPVACVRPALHTFVIPAGVRVHSPNPRAWAIPAGVDQRLRLATARVSFEESREQALAALRSFSVPELLALLERTPRGMPDWPAIDALAGVLLAHHGLDRADGAVVSEPNRLRLADALARCPDERCVPIYEALLARYSQKVDGHVPELFGLGHYYRLARRYQEAADTYLRAEEYTTDPYFVVDAKLAQMSHSAS